jgi:hypothetical protein
MTKQSKQIARTLHGLFAAALACAAFSAPAAASIFGKDKSQAPQWALEAAKIPTPAGAKSADAVLLSGEDLVTIDTQGRTIERRRQAFLIQKPQGRSWGQCGVSFDVGDKVNYFRAWTIKDGKQFAATENDFHEIGHSGDPILLFTEKAFVVTPPGVDPGSIVACESETQTKNYMPEKLWEFQYSIPVANEALEIDLPLGKPHTEAWHAYPATKPTEVSMNHWRWELSQVPALDLREVPSSPDWNALVARMVVQWGETAAEGRDNQWRSIGEKIGQLEEHRPDPTPEITAKTHELIDGAPDFYSRLSRITDYVQKNIRYFIVIRGIGGLQAHPAGDIFRYRYGDCKDKATIIISMLQVANIHAYYVAVDDRRGVVDPLMPSSIGNHMITAIEMPAGVHDDRLQALVTGANGTQYLIFDPTDERTPAGSLRAVLQGSYGTLVAGKNSQVIQLPVLKPEASGAVRKGEFKLAADGTLSGSVDISRIGADGGSLRFDLKYANEKERHDRLEQSLGSEISGVSLNTYKYDEPDALDKPVNLHYEVTAHQYGHLTGPLMLVRPRVVASYAQPFTAKPRTVPINLYATGHWHDSYDIALPDGYVVDEMPDPVNVDTEFASYHSKIEAKDKTLHYERDYTVRQIELAADKQKEFGHFEGMILSDEKATVVLKKQ